MNIDDGEKVVTIQNFINNNYLPSETHIDSINPSNGKIIAKIPSSDKAEADMAVEAARQAFKLWSITSAQERSDYLNRIANEIEARVDEFALAESQDQGKPLWLARNIEIPRAIHNFRFFASAIQHMKNDSTQNTQSKTLNYTTRMPNGVAVLISPWNLPLYLLTWKIAPCIASGCTCVCKPSEFTSLTAYLLCECILRAGVPSGVINIVFGYGWSIGNELVTHPNVDLISFTGGTLTGDRIRQATAQTNKKLSLELGGKNACIIFNDVDLSKYMSDIGRSCFQNSGQICLCSSRIFVHREIYDKFIQELVAYARSLTIGDPLKANTKLGPMVSREHYTKVQSYISKAQELGHKILCGEAVDEKSSELENGCFILPTVLANLSDDSPLMCEEIFGPVVCVTQFHNEDEVIERANSVRYGLAATVWTENLGRAHRVAQALKCGTTWINCFLVRDLNMPFGGMGDSGTGREGNPYSIDFFTELKTICVYHG